MNIISILREVPMGTPLEVPLEVILDLPGPFINGISTWTTDALGVSDITLRIIEPPAAKIFPEPSATIRTPITEMQEDGWYHPETPTSFVSLRIVVSGDPRYRVILQLCNANAQKAIDIIVNLSVSAVPPDQTTLDLLKKMNSTIERIPDITGKIAVKAAKTVLQEQLGTIK